MKKYIIFYMDRVLHELSDMPRASELPDGSYMYLSEERLWYQVFYGTYMPISEPDVPQPLKLWLLLI
jgi:hypothetical protein